jgi:hypothetical protein
MMFALIFWFGISAHAVEMKSETHGTRVEVSFSGLPLPEEELRKQMKSGLTTTFAAQLIVKGASSTFKTLRTFWIVYDLWEERYQVKVLEAETVQKFTSSDAEAVIGQLKSPSFQIPLLKEDAQAQLILTMNPVSREKMEKIRRWLAQNNVNLPSANAVSSKSTVNPETSIKNGVAEKPPTASAEAPNVNVSPIAGARFSGVLAQVLDSELADSSSGAWKFISPAYKLTKGGVHDQ